MTINVLYKICKQNINSLRNFVKWTLCNGVIFPLFKYKFHPSHSLKHTPRIVNQCHRSRTRSSPRRKKRNKSERGDKRVHRMKIVQTMRKFRRWRGLKRPAFLARFRPVVSYPGNFYARVANFDLKAVSQRTRVSSRIPKKFTLMHSPGRSRLHAICKCVG